MEAEHLQDPGDQFAVEAPADKDCGMSLAEIHGTRKHALMPEAEDLPPRTKAHDQRCHSFLGNLFKAPGTADNPQKRPHDTRDNGQHNTLDKCELGLGGHSDDSSVSSQELRPFPFAQL